MVPALLIPSLTDFVTYDRRQTHPAEHLGLRVQAPGLACGRRGLHT